jgi:hypothetical protein
VKYLLSIYLNPTIMDALSETERDEIMAGVDRFMAYVRETGELVGAQALGTPEQSAVVRVRGGVPAVTDGPYLEAKEFLAGYYVVDVESRDRALELAAMVPDAAVNAMEVRPIVFSSDDEA